MPEDRNLPDTVDFRTRRLQCHILQRRALVAPSVARPVTPYSNEVTVANATAGTSKMEMIDLTLMRINKLSEWNSRLKTRELFIPSAAPEKKSNVFKIQIFQFNIKR